MSELEILGAVIGALIALLGLISGFMKLIIAPVNELTVNVTKLVGALDNLSVNQSKFEIQLDKHDTRLDSVEIRLARNSIT